MPTAVEIGARVTQLQQQFPEVELRTPIFETELCSVQGGVCQAVVRNYLNNSITTGARGGEELLNQWRNLVSNPEFNNQLELMQLDASLQTSGWLTAGGASVDEGTLFMSGGASLGLVQQPPTGNLFGGNFAQNAGSSDEAFYVGMPRHAVAIVRIPPQPPDLPGEYRFVDPNSGEWVATDAARMDAFLAEYPTAFYEGFGLDTTIEFMGVFLL